MEILESRDYDGTNGPATPDEHFYCKACRECGMIHCCDVGESGGCGGMKVIKYKP
jgi:hypothetical protein